MGIAFPGAAEARPDLRDQIKEPPRMAVLLYNDDYTTMEFVVEVLTRFFAKTEKQATDLTLEIHTRGKAVAGIYTPEIAEAKVTQVETLARSKGFPLTASMEPL
ncbi:MAG: ATP-dependent Clp protease adaptor ClpS [Oligoflexia bacterium]|jgi:ATP-dependent Clp protease adaptor protein ClpS